MGMRWLRLQGARQGFAAALAQTLAAVQCVPLQHAHALLLACMENVTGSAKASEVNDHYFGQLFGASLAAASRPTFWRPCVLAGVRLAAERARFRASFCCGRGRVSVNVSDASSCVRVCENMQAVLFISN